MAMYYTDYSIVLKSNYHISDIVDAINRILSFGLKTGRSKEALMNLWDMESRQRVPGVLFDHDQIEFLYRDLCESVTIGVKPPSFCCGRAHSIWDKETFLRDWMMWQFESMYNWYMKKRDVTIIMNFDTEKVSINMQNPYN